MSACRAGPGRNPSAGELHPASTSLPVSANVESGFAADPQGAAESVRLAIETGVAGLSIEDATGDAANPLHDIDAAVVRLRAARVAIDQSGSDTLLVGRAKNLFAGRPDLADNADPASGLCAGGCGRAVCAGYSHARADCRRRRCHRAYAGQSDCWLGQRTDDGRHRGAGRAARGGFMRAVRCIADHGRFDGFADAASGADLNSLFRAP